MIRTSSHPLSFSNKGKKEDLCDFIDEYRRVGGLYIDHIWENGYQWEDKKGRHEFNLEKNLLYFPSFIDYKCIETNTFLSARAVSSLVTQVAGMIGAEVEKQGKRLYMLRKLKEEGLPRKTRKQLIKKIKQNIPVRPDCNRLNPELSSKCSDFQASDGEFNGFLRLKSITTRRGHSIKLPIKFHKYSNKMMKRGKMLTSFLIKKTGIDIRWELPDPPVRKDGSILGADQGKRDVLNLSDKQVTPKTDIHGHSLDSILLKMKTLKKGSKAFARAQAHRENFINWSINQLNFNNIKEIRLERVWNIGYRSKQSRIMSHWTNTIIRDKIESKCGEEGIRLIHQSSIYRSQRCSGCGLVRKSNRKGKIYSCSGCGQEIDSDYNASLNHEMNLPEIPWHFRKSDLNRKGFYWLESGLFDLAGTSLESVPRVEL